MRRIIYSAAGVDPQLIKECPEHEKRRNFYIGLLVLLLSLLSLICVSFAANRIFNFNIFNSHLDDYLGYLLSLIIGLFWFLIVFNLYRACLTISGIGDGTSRITRAEMLNSLPQIVLATILACCLAVPLNILFLDQELILSASIQDINKLIQREEDQINQQYSVLIDKFMFQKNDQGSKAIEDLVFVEIERSYKESIDKNSKNFIGILKRIFQQHPFLSSMTFIVLINLYVLPIFLRMLWVKGVYEYLVEYQNQLLLEKNGIYKNYYKVTFIGDHYFDRFLTPERIIKTKGR